MPQRRMNPNTNPRRVVRVNAIVDTPQFPGLQKKNKSMEQVRDFIKEQVRRKGFRFSGGATPQDFALRISGTARFFYGIAFLNPTFGTCALKINNEVVIDTTDTGFFQLGRTQQDYYAINRPLSGSDDIVLTITGDAGYINEPFIVYYK